jgi:hypothetical protein
MSSCNCNNPWHDKWCPSFLPPAETCPDGEPCDEQVSTDCVIYTGPSIPCYGITTGMTVTQLLSILYSSIYPNCSTTTTTLNPCGLCSGFAAIPTIACLYNLKIEFLYIAVTSDLSLLPSGYVHPCPDSIATHNCNRALHEAYLANYYIGDVYMNNANGECGSLTDYGTPICKDFKNTPAALRPNKIWNGNTHSRYTSITLDMDQAIEIAAANSNNSNIVFDLQHAVGKYGISCDGTQVSHDHEVWVRITRADGIVIYNGCDTGNPFTVNVCQLTPYTTTTTTIPVTTTTTLSCATCNTYSVNNTGATPVYVTYRICGSNIYNTQLVNNGSSVTICACTGSIAAPTGSSVTITNTGVCVPTTTTTTV